MWALRGGRGKPLPTPIALFERNLTNSSQDMQQTSINVQPVKGGSEQHNKREKKLDYVREEFSCLNEYWECDTQANRLAFCKENAKTKTGRKMQEKATPIREAVVVIKQETTMQDMKNLAAAFQERFGIETFQIAIHKDEGHHKGKEWKPNLHAHMVFDWTAHNSGKSIKLSRPDMVEMQTIAAEVLGMERGVSSDKKHLTALQWKNKREEEQQILLEAETKRLKVGKARKEAAIETAKSVSEGVKSLLGISTKEKEINTLRSEINRQKQEIKQITVYAQKKIAEEKQKALRAKEKEYSAQLMEVRRQRDTAIQRAKEFEQQAKYQKKRADLFAYFWTGVDKAVKAVVEFAEDNLHRFFSPSQVSDIDQALGNRPIEIRKALGYELIERAKKLLQPIHQLRLDNISRDVRDIAERKYISRDRGRSMSR